MSMEFNETDSPAHRAFATRDAMPSLSGREDAQDDRMEGTFLDGDPLQADIACDAGCGACDVCEKVAEGMADGIALELSGAYSDSELLALEHGMLVDDFVDAVFEFEDVTLRVNPLTEARYSVNIGIWERALSKAKLDARKAKLRLELATDDYFEGRPIIDERIDAQVFAKYGAADERLSGMRSRTVDDMSMCFASHDVTGTKWQEMGEDYRLIIRRCHSTIAHGTSLLDAHRLAEAHELYARGDADGLRQLALEVDVEGLVNAGEPSDGAPLSADEMAVECELIRAQLESVRAQLSHVKRSFPYKFAALVNDASWTCTKAMNLRGAVESFHAAIRTYREQYQALKMRARLFQG